MVTKWTYQHAGPMVEAYRKAFAHLRSPGATIKMNWAATPIDMNGFRREFVEALHRRINLKQAPTPKWRKLSERSQVAMRRDKHRLEDMHRRIRVYQFETDECRRRFGDRLARYDD